MNSDCVCLSVCLFQLRVSHVDDDVTFSCEMKLGDDVIENCSLTLDVLQCECDVTGYCVDDST